MNLIANIAKRHYLATPADVENLARSFQEAQDTRTNTRGTYFRVLLAAVQKDVLGKPVLRALRGPAKAMTDEDTKAHLEALEAANEPLYAAVLRGVEAPGLDAKERNRRSGFARSATATIRAFIRAGGDIRRIPVPQATKNAMRDRTGAPGGVAASPEDQARRRIQRAAKRLTGAVEALAQSDRALAVEAVRISMDQVNALLLKYAGRPTTNAAQAVAEHRPFKTDAGTFLPAIRITEGVSSRPH